VGERRVNGDYVRDKFKENNAPLLEVDERGQLRTFVLDQEKQLNSYGWVDQKAGVAHIPIDQAMRLIAERGLPVCAQGCANAAAPAATPAAAQKPASTKKAAGKNQ
jgi:hypothetical protein